MTTKEVIERLRKAVEKECWTLALKPTDMTAVLDSITAEAKSILGEGV